MAKPIYADETVESFLEVAKYLRRTAGRVDAIADLFHQEGVEVMPVPLKTKLFEALGAVEAWAGAADAAFLKYKKDSGAMGPTTAGQSPLAGRKLKPPEPEAKDEPEEPRNGEAKKGRRKRSK